MSGTSAIHSGNPPPPPLAPDGAVGRPTWVAPAPTRAAAQPAQTEVARATSPLAAAPPTLHPNILSTHSVSGEAAAQDALPAAVEEIRRRLSAMETLLEGVANPGGACRSMAPPGGCRHRKQLQESLRETIEVIEESRKAFRSRRLELLRGKLTRILSEID